MTLDPLPWLGWDPQHGAYCLRCGHGVADATCPWEHDPTCPVHADLLVEA